MEAFGRERGIDDGLDLECGRRIAGQLAAEAGFVAGLELVRVREETEVETRVRVGVEVLERSADTR
jgi:hypothetical protein